jgi:hypothetical protein
MLMASAWEPYQELFQGVAACIHADFRIGGLKPGESKSIRGKISCSGAGIDFGGVARGSPLERSKHQPAP